MKAAADFSFQIRQGNFLVIEQLLGFLKGNCALAAVVTVDVAVKLLMHGLPYFLPQQGQLSTNTTALAACNH